MDRFRVSRISLIEKYGKPVNTELTGRMILRLFHGLSSCLPQLKLPKGQHAGLIEVVFVETFP